MLKITRNTHRGWVTYEYENEEDYLIGRARNVRRAFMDEIENAGSLVESDLLTEKWGKDVKIEKTGEHAGKSVDQIKKEIEALKGKPGNKEKMGELLFALRAKQGWKKGGGATGLSKEDEELIEMALTKKDFITLANIIKTGKDQGKMADKIVDWLQGQNPKFDAKRFKKAAGMQLSEEEIEEDKIDTGMIKKGYTLKLIPVSGEHQGRDPLYAKTMQQASQMMRDKDFAQTKWKVEKLTEQKDGEKAEKTSENEGGAKDKWTVADFKDQVDEWKKAGFDDEKKLQGMIDRATEIAKKSTESAPGKATRAEVLGILQGFFQEKG